MREDAVFSALSDPHRRHLLETLAGRDSASLTELAAELPVTRQAVSRQAEHVLRIRARGRWIRARCSAQTPAGQLRGRGVGQACDRRLDRCRQPNGHAQVQRLHSAQHQCTRRPLAGPAGCQHLGQAQLVRGEPGPNDRADPATFDPNQAARWTAVADRSRPLAT